MHDSLRKSCEQQMHTQIALCPLSLAIPRCVDKNEERLWEQPTLPSDRKPRARELAAQAGVRLRATEMGDQPPSTHPMDIEPKRVVVVVPAQLAQWITFLWDTV